MINFKERKEHGRALISSYGLKLKASQSSLDYKTLLWVTNVLHSANLVVNGEMHVFLQMRDLCS